MSASSNEYYQNWTLFLDRDGVINERLPGDYVKHPDEFTFRPGVEQAMAELSGFFPRIFIVTNQQGVGKGLMTDGDLARVHKYMIDAIHAAGGRIDRIYCCTDLASTPENCRKPNPAMGLSAKADFPDTDFGRSIMVGDSDSDMAFGHGLGMVCVRVTSREDQRAAHEDDTGVPFHIAGLPALVGLLRQEKITSVAP